MPSLRTFLAMVPFAATAGCATAPPPPAVSVDPVQAGLTEAAGWTGATDTTILLSGQQALAGRRYRESHALFAARGEQFPARPLYRSFEGLLALKMADEIPC